MATAPRPRILPKITYAPPTDPPDTSGLGAGGGAGYNPNRDMPIDRFGQWLGGGINNALAGIFPSNDVRSGNPIFWGDDAGAQVGAGMGQVGVGGGQMPTDLGGRASTYYGAAGAPVESPPARDPRGVTPPNAPNANIYEAKDSPNWRPPSAPGGAATPPPSALTNNRSNYDTAVKAGDTQNIARLNAEWERLKSTSVYQKMYGGQDDYAMQKRLIDVYMNPNDRGAGNDFESAAGAMIADDIWAEAFRMATGRAPNDVEWVDHNVGRDPLTGHPEAIQWMEQKSKELQQGNQIGAQQSYQQLLDKNKNIMS